MNLLSTRTDTFFGAGFILLLLVGCYQMRNSSGGGQIQAESPKRTIDVSDVALPKGYRMEVVTTGLTFPTGITFDSKGRPYVTESGYSYGEEWTRPRLLRIEQNGDTTLVASGKKNGPWNGVDFFEGHFYVAEGGHLQGGKILKISPEGKVTALIENLPSWGDHHTNGPVVRKGYVYFGQGTATNSGVVGNDNAEFGWLFRNESFHDIPCKDITLTGHNFTSKNILTKDTNDQAVTGAYVPYNTPTKKGQVIKGQVPCNGSVMRIPMDGGPPELVAWGFRNPFGLAFNQNGQLFLTDNAYDVRGNRPVWGTGDLLWHVKKGTWYGWPDFSGQKALSGSAQFRIPRIKPLNPLLATHPNAPPPPSAILGVHSSSNGIDFSFSENFGYQGKAFIAQFGDMAPGVGKVISPVGFKVVSVDVSNGVIENFAVNKGKRNGPASWLNQGGLERPVDVKFHPSGEALYIVDFGIMTTSQQEPRPIKETGVVFKILRER